jgi:hypothetical protein
VTVRAGDLLFETLVLRSRVPATQLVDGWRRVRSRGLPALADFEGGAIWILRRLREIGAAGVAPPVFVEAIGAQARGDAARNLLVDAEAARVVRRLDAAGIPCVLIKGVARRAGAGRWPFADARATKDVDLIVPVGEAQRAWDDLICAGYHGDLKATKYHLPGLIGEGRVGVELHTSLIGGLPADEAWRRANAGSMEVEWQGASVRVPSATELLWHGLTHALSQGLNAWRLRFLLDGAAILAGDDAIAWDVIRARCDAAEVDPVSALRWLGSAAQLAGVDLPALLRVDAGSFDVRRVLRWRLGVLARGGDAGFTGRLLEEGTRVELGLPVTPVPDGVGSFRRTRRWVAGRLARVTYRAWRTAA